MSCASELHEKCRRSGRKRLISGTSPHFTLVPLSEITCITATHSLILSSRCEKTDHRESVTSTKRRDEMLRHRGDRNRKLCPRVHVLLKVSILSDSVILWIKQTKMIQQASKTLHLLPLSRLTSSNKLPLTRTEVTCCQPMSHFLYTLNLISPYMYPKAILSNAVISMAASSQLDSHRLRC